MLKKHQNRIILYYALYLILIWPIIVYVLPNSETIKSLAKYIFLGLPLLFILKNNFKQIFLSTKKEKIIFKNVLISIFTSLILIFIYSFTLNHTIGSGAINNISIWFMLNAVFLAPIIEEVIFRGYLLNKFQEYNTFWKANIYQSFLFLLIHIPLWISREKNISLTSYTWIILFGIVLGLVKQKSNWLGSSIIVHSIGNLIIEILR